MSSMEHMVHSPTLPPRNHAPLRHVSMEIRLISVSGHKTAPVRSFFIRIERGTFTRGLFAPSFCVFVELSRARIGNRRSLWRENRRVQIKKACETLT